MVSVIIPCYNSEKTIGFCLESILNQTYSDIEVITVDDGSTDKTSEIIRTYSDRDSRILLIRKENGGVSSARNLGIHVAHGDWLLFVDSDDTILNTHIETLIKNAVSPSSIVISGFKEVRDGKILDGIKMPTEIYEPKDGLAIGIGMIPYPKNYRIAFAGPCAKLIPKKIVVENNIFFPEDLSLGEDNLFIYECYSHCDKIVIVHEHLYLYHIISNSGSLSSKGTVGMEMTIESQRRLYAKKVSLLLEKGILDDYPQIYHGTYIALWWSIRNTAYGERVKYSDIKQAFTKLISDKNIQTGALFCNPEDIKERIICYLIRHKNITFLCSTVYILNFFLGKKS